MLLGLVALVGSMACLLNNAPATSRTSSVRHTADEEKSLKNACQFKVCPLWAYGHFGEFCGYYAKRCSNGEYVNLYAECGLAGNNCVEPCTGCVDVGPSWLRLEKAGEKPVHYFDSSPKGPVLKGVNVKAPPTKIIEKDSYAKLVGAPMLASLTTTKDGTNKAKVMLYLVLVTPPIPKDLKEIRPPRLFGSGLEVSEEKSPEFAIPYGDIVMTSGKEGKVCLVKVGSVTYQVVLGKKTPLDPVVGKKKDD
jgi:hypothetical protein